MSKIDEAIKYFEYKIPTLDNRPKRSVIAVKQNYETALAALREKEARERPLTLEQLEHMTGMPVWLVNIRTTGSCGYVFIRSIYADGIVFHNTYNERWYRLSNYGKTWLAYTNKPGEAG